MSRARPASFRADPGRASAEAGQASVESGQASVESGQASVESGQASVELVAAVPLVLLAAAVAWQLVLTGHTLWLCANAARAAARADAVGLSPGRAARSALPKALERGLTVERRAAGGVRVEVRLPLLLGSWGSPVRVAAVASLGAPR